MAGLEHTVTPVRVTKYIIVEVSDSIANADPVTAGDLVARLLCSPSSWMKRRKLHVTFIDDVALRLRHSVDFHVPDKIEPTAEDKQGVSYVHLPLFVLRKAPQELLDFDLVDALGNARSLPTRQCNTDISYQALLARSAQILGVSQAAAASVDGMPIELMHATAYEDPPNSLDACDKLLVSKAAGTADATRARLAADDDFRFLARLVSWSSVVVIPTACRPGEHLIKLAYSEPIEEWEEWGLRIRAGVDPLPARIDLPFVGGQTFHLEAHPPAGMVVESGLLGVLTRRGFESRKTEKSARAMHLYLPELEQGRSGAAFLSLRAQRGGFMENALAACGAVAAVLVLSTVFAPQLAKANATVPTLMLFLPGLLATIVLQPTAHALTHHILAMIRNAVLFCAALAYLAALWLVVAPSEQVKAYTQVIPAPISNDASPKGAAASSRREVPSRRPEGAKSRSDDPRPATNGASGTGRNVLVQTTSRPSTVWLRVGWGFLSLLAIGAFSLTALARRRARP